LKKNVKALKTIHRPYQRLLIDLEKIISATPPGERLKSEPDLSKHLGVSRATLREAMRSFENQGLIRRQQGIGTFVVGQTHPIETGLEVLESIESRANRIHLNVSMGDLNIEKIQADEKLSDDLNVPMGQSLIRIQRVIFTEKLPIAYLEDVLPENILSPDELTEGFTGSVLDFLLKRGLPQLAHSKTEISATVASPELARALQIQRSDVLLKFTAQLVSTEGAVIDHSISHFLPGYFRFHVVRRVGNNKKK
jgi:GntR family transcriptional regulator